MKLVLIRGNVIDPSPESSKSSWLSKLSSIILFSSDDVSNPNVSNSKSTSCSKSFITISARPVGPIWKVSNGCSLSKGGASGKSNPVAPADANSKST